MVTDPPPSDPSLASGILDALRYFGLFNHPLTASEIHRFHPLPCRLDEILPLLDALVDQGRVKRISDDLFSLSDDKGQERQRREGTDRALALLGKARFPAKIIGWFPFVRSVAVSGSLSKYVAGPDADIDFFIITATHRLWIARTLLHLFKKFTFLTGSQHRFCMNYFVDESAGEIGDRNIYTAIETVTLIPVHGWETFSRFRDANRWTSRWLPNDPGMPDRRYLDGSRPLWVRTLAEYLLERVAPDRVNLYLMKLTDRKWRRKWRRKNFPMEEYDEAFLTTPNVSKNHPANFRKKILNALENQRP